jgi:hypothetical protein
MEIATPCKLRVHHQPKYTNLRILQVRSNHTVQIVPIIRQQAKATRANPAAIMAHLWRRILIKFRILIQTWFLAANINRKT